MPSRVKMVAASRAIDSRQSTSVPNTSNRSALMVDMTYPQNRWISLCKNGDDLTGDAEICHVARRDHKMITPQHDPARVRNKCPAERCVPSAQTAATAERVWAPVLAARRS